MASTDNQGEQITHQELDNGRIRSRRNSSALSRSRSVGATPSPTCKLLWVLAAVSVIGLAVNGIQARNIIAIFAAVVILGAIAVILFVIPNKSERS